MTSGSGKNHFSDPPPLVKVRMAGGVRNNIMSLIFCYCLDGICEVRILRIEGILVCVYLG
jgi:hypothetical protein